jgi:hypothetical protein
MPACSLLQPAAFVAAAIDQMAYRYQDIVFGKQGGTV